MEIRANHLVHIKTNEVTPAEICDNVSQPPNDWILQIPDVDTL